MNRNVKAEAARAGLTQTDIAEGLTAAGVRISVASVGRRWNGRAPWELQELDGIAALTGCERSALVAGA